MPELKAKVKIDTTDVERAEGRLIVFAERFEHHFKSHFSRAFGSIALIGGAIETIKEAFSKPAEIDATAKKLQLATDEVQLLTIGFKEMGLTFEEGIERAKRGTIDLVALMAKMRKEHGMSIISHEDVKTISEDVKKLGEIKEAILGGAAHGAVKTQGLLSQQWDWLKFKINGWFPGISGMRDEQRRAMIAERRKRGIPIGPELEAWEKGGAPAAPAPANSPGLNRLIGQANAEADSKRLEYLKRKTEAGYRLNANEQAFLGQFHPLLKPQQYDLDPLALTARQQVGAYAGGSVSAATKLDEQKQVLERIDGSIGDIKDMMQNRD